MPEDFPVPKVSEDAAVVLDKNQNTSKAPVKRLSAMSVRDFFERYAEPLQMKLVGSESGFDRRIIEPELNRPGLALAGFFTYFAEQRIQVIGNAEHSYLTCHAPPATVLRHDLQCQMPTHVRFIAFLPQNEHVYLQENITQ